jgi:hypothetical protein
MPVISFVVNHNNSKHIRPDLAHHKRDWIYFFKNKAKRINPA